MSHNVALQGGHNDQNPVRIEKFRCGGTIAVGDVVKLDTSAAGDFGRVVECTQGVPPVGVALEAGTDGTYIRVQTWGIGLVALTTSGSVAADALMIPHSTAGQVTADAVAADTVGHLVLGIALADDSSTSQAAGTYFLCPIMGAGA